MPGSRTGPASLLPGVPGALDPAWEPSWGIPEAEPPQSEGAPSGAPCPRTLRGSGEDGGAPRVRSTSPCSSRAARTEPCGNKSSLLSAVIQIHRARAPFSPSCSRRFRFGLDSSEFTDRLLHFNSMAFPSWGRHISKYHIYQKACAKTRARITLLMVPPITTTTINFSGKKTHPGTFWARVWERGPALGCAAPPGLASSPHPGPAHLVSLAGLGFQFPGVTYFPRL